MTVRTLTIVSIQEGKHLIPEHPVHFIAAEHDFMLTAFDFLYRNPVIEGSKPNLGRLIHAVVGLSLQKENRTVDLPGFLRIAHKGNRLKG